jgi:hypothetical protein
MHAATRVSYGGDVINVDPEAGALKLHLMPRLPGFMAGSFASSGGRSLAS